MKPDTELPSAFNSSFEPQLSPDFAARVMREAGRIRTQRRIRRRVIGTLAGTAAVLGIYLMPTSQLIARHRTATITQQTASASVDWDDADSGTQAFAYSDTDEADSGSAVNYLFPDVQSLEEFSDEYSAGSTSATDYTSWNSGTI